MITSLQLALKEFFPDGLAAKSHSGDFEVIQGLTFGGILRAKEKQLQDAQTVSASSIAAAVAAMQALPIVQSVVVANVNQVFTETQTVDAQGKSTREFETPEAPLHQLKQTGSTILGVGLSQGTSQTFIETGMPASVVATGTGMDTGKVMAPPDLSPVTATGSSETEKVLRQSASKIEVTRVTTLQPVANSSLEAGAVSTETIVGNESRDVPVHSAAYSETIKAASNLLKSATRPFQPGTDQEKTSTDTKMTGMQVSENLQPAEVSHLKPETPVKISPAKIIDSESGKSAGKVVSRTEIPVLRPAQSKPDVAPERVEANPKGIAIGGKQVGLRVDTNQNSAVFADKQVVNLQFADPEPVAEFPQDAKETHPIGGVSTSLNLGDETRSVPLQTVVQAKTADAASIQVPPQIPLDGPAKSTGKADFEPDIAEKYINAASLLPDIPQPESESAEFPVTVNIHPAETANVEVRTGELHTSIKADASVAASTQAPVKNSSDQNISNPEKPNAKMDQEEIGLDVSKSMTEGLQFERESGKVPVTEKISPEPVIVNETRQGKQPAVRVEAPTLASTRPVQGTHSAPAMSGSERPATDSKVVETQAGVRAAAMTTPQIEASVLERGQDVQAAEDSPKPNSQHVISANAAGKFEHALATSENQADATGNLPVPVQPVRQEAAQPDVTPDGTGKVQSHQAAIKSNLFERVNGEVDPAEKQQETNPGIETVAAQTPRARENLVRTVAGTGSGAEAKIRTAEVVQQIVHHVEARIHNRSMEMHLQLNPKELGVIDVQMVSGPQGVSVTFSAERPATGRLLETQLNQLQQALTDAGVQISGLNIGQHGQPRQEGGFLNQNPQFAQSTQHDASRKEADMQEPRRPVRVTGALGEVDYLI